MSGTGSARTTYRPLLLSGGLHASAGRTPGKAALLCQGVTRSYGELSERVRRVAGAAVAAGLRPGDRVAVVAPNCIEYPELVCGLADAGAVVATLSPRLTPREIAEACDDCGARMVIAHPETAETVMAARFSSVERRIVLGDEYESWIARAAPILPLETLDETDPFTLVYSSGTTGKPKGIVISHRSRALTFHGMAMEYGCYGPDDLQLGIAPMAHGAGFAFIMASLYFGGTVDVLPKFEPELVLRKLGSDAFTGVFMVPAHFHAIFSQEVTVLDRWRGRFPALRTIMSNAAALPQAAKERIVEYWGAGLLHETYGSTEAGVVTNLRPADQLLRKQSVGRPFALNEVRLLDDDGLEVAPGEIGELYSRSPYLFNGFYGKPAETAAVMRNGWLTAGDLARRDEDGYFYIVDRKKDMVVTGGLNVYPREIEEQLHQHPAVLEAAVVGVPDERWGEALQAFVVLRAAAEAQPAELERYCRERLAGYKVPRRFLYVDALPRNAGGKVLKTELRTVARRDDAA
jgi:acyl-CoA synthetase (AMP-forming)/AMP-acid ligase II